MADNEFQIEVNGLPFKVDSSLFEAIQAERASQLDSDSLGETDHQDSDEIAELEERIDALEGELAVANQLLKQHADMKGKHMMKGKKMEDEDEYEEEDDEKSDSEDIQARLDSIFAAHADAKDYLPDDYQITGKSSPHCIRVDALKEASPDLEINWDSEAAVEAAYSFMKSHVQPKVDSSSEIQDALTSPPSQSPLAERQDMGGYGFPHDSRQKLKPATFSKKK